MKQRTTALLTAAALALSLLGATALAAEGDSSPGTQAGDPAAPEVLLSAQQSSAAPEAAEDTGSAEEDAVPEYIPDPVGTITFANLEHRMREGNLNLLTLEENIQAIKAIDYDEMKEDLRQGLNQIASAQWMMIEFGQGDSYAYQTMETSYRSLRETFDDIKDGKLQSDNADLIRQLENAQNQVIMAGETLYIALLDMERTDQGLARQQTALDRTLTELELRYQLGHISSQTLKQTQAGRTALVRDRKSVV